MDKQLALFKLLGSFVLIITVTGILLAVGGQLEFIGAKKRQDISVPEISSDRTNKEPPKFDFYDDLKKYKTELNNQQYVSSPAAPKEKKETSSATKYVIQVGAYSKQKVAQQVEKKIKSLGYPARIIRSGAKYLTQAGPFAGKDKASSAKKRLTNQKFDTLMKKI